MAQGALQYAQPGTYAPGSAEFQSLMAAPFFANKRNVGSVTVDPTGGFKYSTYGPANQLARQISGALSHAPIIGGQVAAGQRAADAGDWTKMILHGLAAGGQLGGLVAGGLAAGGVPVSGGRLGIPNLLAGSRFAPPAGLQPTSLLGRAGLLGRQGAGAAGRGVGQAAGAVGRAAGAPGRAIAGRLATPAGLQPVGLGGRMAYFGKAVGKWATTPGQGGLIKFGKQVLKTPLGKMGLGGSILWGALKMGGKETGELNAQDVVDAYGLDKQDAEASLKHYKALIKMGASPEDAASTAFPEVAAQQQLQEQAKLQMAMQSASEFINPYVQRVRTAASAQAEALRGLLPSMPKEYQPVLNAYIGAQEAEANQDVAAGAISALSGGVGIPPPTGGGNYGDIAALLAGGE